MQSVKLSSKGQFILPKTIRDQHNWGAGTEFLIIDRGEELVIRPIRLFPETTLEYPDSPSIYSGQALSLADMEQAVQEEAGKHQ